MVACLNDSYEIAKIIIDNIDIRDINSILRYKNNKGVNCLYYAIKNGNSDIVKLIINSVHDKQEYILSSGNKFTVLMYACEKGDLDLVKFILSFIDDKKSYILQTTNQGWNCIKDAVKFNKLDILKYLFSFLSNDEITNIIDVIKHHIFFNYINEDIMNYINNTKVNTQYFVDCIINNDLNAFMKCKDLFVTDKYSKTYLMYACQRRRIDIVKYIFDKVPRVEYLNHHDNCGWNFITELINNDCIEILNIIPNSAWNNVSFGNTKLVENMSLKTFSILHSIGWINKPDDFKKLLEFYHDRQDIIEYLIKDLSSRLTKEKYSNHYLHYIFFDIYHVIDKYYETNELINTYIKYTLCPLFVLNVSSGKIINPSFLGNIYNLDYCVKSNIINDKLLDEYDDYIDTCVSTSTLCEIMLNNSNLIQNNTFFDKLLTRRNFNNEQKIKLIPLYFQTPRSLSSPEYNLICEMLFRLVRSDFYNVIEYGVKHYSRDLFGLVLAYVDSHISLHYIQKVGELIKQVNNQNNDLLQNMYYNKKASYITNNSKLILNLLNKADRSEYNKYIEYDWEKSIFVNALLIENILINNVNKKIIEHLYTGYKDDIFYYKILYLQNGNHGNNIVRVLLDNREYDLVEKILSQVSNSKACALLSQKNIYGENIFTYCYAYNILDKLEIVLNLYKKYDKNTIFDVCCKLLNDISRNNVNYVFVENYVKTLKLEKLLDNLSTFFELCKSDNDDLSNLLKIARTKDEFDFFLSHRSLDGFDGIMLASSRNNNILSELLRLYSESEIYEFIKRDDFRCLYTALINDNLDGLKILLKAVNNNKKIFYKLYAYHNQHLELDAYRNKTKKVTKYLSDIVMSDIDSSLQCLDVEIIINNLDVISSINPHYKLWCCGDKLEIDTSYIPSVSRWWNSQGRDVSMSMINRTIHMTFYKLNTVLINKINNVVKGLENIKLTYPDKSNDIDKLINFISEKI